MTILSIDVGIKNLAYCLLDECVIHKWDVLSLVNNEKYVCCAKNKEGQCKSEAKFTKNGNMYCLKHAKKCDYIVPNSEIKPSNIKKMDIIKLKALADKYSIEYDYKLKKKDLTKELLDFFENKCFELIEVTNASDVDLITIGRALKKSFDETFPEDCIIRRVIIENQISPIANRMKTLQGMIAQYFIMRNSNIHIEFVSAVNKLKDFTSNDGILIDGSSNEILSENTVVNSNSSNMSYNQRKKLGVEKCGKLIKEKNYTEWYQFFINNKKKDDLSDAFLQGIWYIHQNKS